MAYLVLRTLLANHQTPREIITDRGSLFTSTFWQNLLRGLGSKPKLSTSFHPQTDGQTERTNQTLEQYLRIFSNNPQDNWVELLPMAQFAYNSSRSSTTRRTPFYANYGYEPTAYREEIAPKTSIPMLNGSQGINEQAARRVQELRSLHEKLRQQIAQQNEKASIQANKKRIKGPILKGGDKVYLSTKNLPTGRPSKKLDAVRIGPFEVKKRIKEVNYELRLPRNMRIRPVFHVSLLEPAPADAPLETDIEMEPDQKNYEVDQLLDVRKFGNQWRYLIRWKNYAPEEDSWEPLKCLNCPQSLEQFHKENPGKADPRSKGYQRAPQANCQGRPGRSRQRRHQKKPQKEQVARIQQSKTELRDSQSHPHGQHLLGVPDLQSKINRELRTQSRVAGGSEVAFRYAPRWRKHLVAQRPTGPPQHEDSPEPHRNDAVLRAAQKKDDQSVAGPLAVECEANRDSFQDDPIWRSGRTGRNENRENSIQRTTQKTTKYGKDASSSHRVNRALSLKCLRPGTRPRGQPDGQPKHASGGPEGMAERRKEEEDTPSAAGAAHISSLYAGPADQDTQSLKPTLRDEAEEEEGACYEQPVRLLFTVWSTKQCGRAAMGRAGCRTEPPG